MNQRTAIIATAAAAVLESLADGLRGGELIEAGDLAAARGVLTLLFDRLPTGYQKGAAEGQTLCLRELPLPLCNELAAQLAWYPPQLLGEWAFRWREYAASRFCHGCDTGKPAGQDHAIDCTKSGGLDHATDCAQTITIGSHGGGSAMK